MWPLRPLPVWHWYSIFLKEKPGQEPETERAAWCKGYRQHCSSSSVPTTLLSFSCSVVSDSLQPRQAPLSMGFSRQVYWSALPFPSPGDLPDSGIEPRAPELQADSLPSERERFHHQGNLLTLTNYYFLKEAWSRNRSITPTRINSKSNGVLIEQILMGS